MFVVLLNATTGGGDKKPIFWLSIPNDEERRVFHERYGCILEADGWRYVNTVGTRGYHHDRTASYTMTNARAALEHKCGMPKEGTDRFPSVEIVYRLAPAPPPPKTAPVLNLSEQLYAERECGHADFAFVSRTGTEFKVHKSVLAIRSEVLKSAFDNGGLSEHCIDLKANQLPMPHADDQAVGAFVKAIYTGQYELEYSTGKDSVLALLQLADMYMLADLKKNIERDLLRCVDRSNALAMANLADKFGLELLSDKVFAGVPAAAK